MLTQVEDVIPKWKIVPTKDVINAAFKDPTKREQVSWWHLIVVAAAVVAFYLLLTEVTLQKNVYVTSGF